jgi:hypothetical protein
MTAVPREVIPNEAVRAAGKLNAISERKRAGFGLRPIKPFYQSKQPVRVESGSASIFNGISFLLEEPA